MDCQIDQLSLKGAQIPIIMGDCHAQSDLQSIPLRVTKTTEVPARSFSVTYPSKHRTS